MRHARHPSGWSAYSVSRMAEDEYRNGRHVVYKLHVHLIFVTKYRKKVITDRVTEELRSAFEEVCGRHAVTPSPSTPSKPTTTTPTC